MHLNSVANWLNCEDSFRCCVAVGSRPLINHAFALACVKQFEGPSIYVDLHSVPAETLASWIPRFSESNSVRMNWNVFSLAFQQLYAMIRGADLDAEKLEAPMSATDQLEEDAALINSLREGMKFIEADLIAIRDKNGEPPLVVLDGLEILTRISSHSSDVGRRGVSVFLETIWRFGERNLARPLITCDASFFLQYIALPRRLLTPHLVSLREAPSAATDVEVSLSRARFMAALKSSAAVMTYAPLGVEIGNLWTEEDVSNLLCLISEKRCISLDLALETVASIVLIALMRSQIIAIDIENLNVSVVSSADAIAVEQMIKEGKIGKKKKNEEE
jgi:hypothetical protein